MCNPNMRPLFQNIQRIINYVSRQKIKQLIIMSRIRKKFRAGNISKFDLFASSQSVFGKLEG